MSNSSGSSPYPYSVTTVNNDALGETIWSKRDDEVSYMLHVEVNGQCAAVPAIEVYGHDDRLIALTILGPGMTVHYEKDEP